MAVMMPREKWTDERLDDLNKRVDEGFTRVEALIADTKTDMREGFARVDGQINELRRDMNARFESIDARFDALNRNLFWGMVTVVVALIGSNAF
jgi:uncharacterized protein YicC (UPF0701 family)